MSLDRRLFLAVALLVAPSAANSQDRPSAATVVHLADSLARDFLAAGSTPSVAVGITRGGEELTFAAFGKADLENDTDATPESVYRIGSVTKQFTSTAIMQLIEAGELALDDRLVTHLPHVPEIWHDVTLTQLLNHTSGIPSYTDLGPEWQKRWGEEMTPDTIIGLVFDVPMDFEPGSSWTYNNTGYILLGMLIEKVTGNSWEDDLQTRFAQPLGLDDTRNCLTTPMIPRRVHGYAKDGEDWANAAFLAMTQPYAAGAMCSTVVDMARWNQALHSGGLVSGESYQKMITPVGAANTAEQTYGFGVGPGEIEGVEIVQHGGGIHGFSSSNVWIPAADISITVFTNATGGSSGRLMRKLARITLGVPLTAAAEVAPPEVQSLDPSERAKYVGVYAMDRPGGPRDITVALTDQGLTAQPQNATRALAMIYYGEHTFGLEGQPDVGLVFTVEDGVATGLSVSTPGGTLEGKRK
jgi:D-alanyl-D-alanine carboxypeptidase